MKYLVIYLCLTSLGPILRGIRWHYMLNYGTFYDAIKGIYIGKAGNNLFPLRLGDAIRCQFAKDAIGVQYSLSVSTVLSETVLDLVALAILSLIASIFLPILAPYRIYMLLFLAIIFITVVYVVRYKNVGMSSRNTVFIRILQRLIPSLRMCFCQKRTAAILVMTVVIWGYTIITMYASLLMLLPNVSLSGVVATIVFLYLSAAIPSAPGFLGTYHASIAAGILVMGYSIQDYSALPILSHIIQYVAHSIIGVIFGFTYLFHNDWHSVLSNYRSYITHISNKS